MNSFRRDFPDTLHKSNSTRSRSHNTRIPVQFQQFSGGPNELVHEGRLEFTNRIGFASSAVNSRHYAGQRLTVWSKHVGHIEKIMNLLFKNSCTNLTCFYAPSDSSHQSWNVRVLRWIIFENLWRHQSRNSCKKIWLFLRFSSKNKLNDHFDFVPYNIKNETYAIKHRPRIETTSSAWLLRSNQCFGSLRTVLLSG